MARTELPTTTRGRTTRDRIVAAAAELMYRHGVGGTSTPAIRDAAGVSSSQIYHYFADKDDLTAAVIAHQAGAILTQQAPLLARVADLDDLGSWRDEVIGAARVHAGAGGCPLGSLSSELSGDSAWAREAASAGFDAWTRAIATGLANLVRAGALREDTDVDRLALALLAALQGGLLLAQAQQSTIALEAALDTVLEQVRDHAPR